ncbi:MAG: hypothetical protein Q8O61_05595 [Nocardioides sp.]|nr:hypothetical protein [Nocardioides sp.]
MVLGIVGTLALAGCSDPLTPEAPDPTPPADAASVLPSTAAVPPDLLKAFRRLLDRRAASLLEGDAGTFRAGIAKGDPDFVAQQLGYLDNLSQLPLGALSYDVDRGSLLRQGDSYWVTVDVALQLSGYDSVPVRALDRYRFSPSRRDPERFVVSSVTDEEWEAVTDPQPQPWDLGPVEVRERLGVLGIFDQGSLGAAPELMSSVERGVSDVRALVPYPWDASVVVYALSDPEFLGTIDDLPGGDPDTLDGVAFPVSAGPGSAEVASTRFVLNPRMLDRTGPGRDRLVRHELTHVAMAGHDTHAPVWLSEGIAEYVSVRPLAPEDRRIDPEAIRLAKAGVDALPDDSTFNDADSAANYGLAWWACEYVAATYGETTLWSLLDYVNVPGSDPGKRMQMAIGLNSRQLARKGARLLLQTFAPELLEPKPTSTTGPTTSPTPDPSGGPTPSPTPTGTTSPQG